MHTSNTCIYYDEEKVELRLKKWTNLNQANLEIILKKLKKCHSVETVTL